MENFIVEGKKETPEFIIDVEKHRIKLIGKSLPENAYSFYDPILNKVKEYVKEYMDFNTIFDFKLEYVNTSSSKMLKHLLEFLSPIGDKLYVNWYYEEDDEDIMEMGQIYSESFPDFKFTFKEIIE